MIRRNIVFSYKIKSNFKLDHENITMTEISIISALSPAIKKHKSDTKIDYFYYRSILLIINFAFKK